MAVPATGAATTVVFGDDVATAIGALGTNDASHLGSGCWEAVKDQKMELYIDPTVAPFSSLDSFTIDEIASISYWTNKPGAEGDVDFYLAIYTVPDGNDDYGWYGYRLNGEPYFSDSLNAAANTWNEWNTDVGTNQLTFFDTAKTGTYGFYGQPTLQDLQATDSFDWSGYYSCASTAINYGAETVKFISFQTGSGWMDTFEGYLDYITITLTTGESLTIDLEKDSTLVNLGVDVPDIVAISVSPTVINFGTLLPGETSDVFGITVDNIGTRKVDVVQQCMKQACFTTTCSCTVGVGIYGLTGLT